MPNQTHLAPVTSGEIVDLLDAADTLLDDPTVTEADRLAFYELKADLLARIAAQQQTDHARAAHRHALGQVARFRARTTGGASGRWSA